MSQYKYKFIRNGNTIESVGYNLWNGAENAGITITRADRLAKWKLQELKFEDRVRTVHGIQRGEMMSHSYEVHQSYNK